MESNISQRQLKEKEYIIRRYNNNFLVKFYLDLFVKENKLKLNKNELDNDHFYNECKKKILINIIKTNYKFETKEFLYTVVANEQGLEINKFSKGTINNSDKYLILFNEITNMIISMCNNDNFITEFEKKYIIFVPFLYETIYKKDNSLDIDLDNNTLNSKEKGIQYLLNMINYIKHTNATNDLIKKYNCNSNEDIKNRILLDKKFQKELKYIVFNNYNNGIFSKNNKMIILSQNILTALIYIDKIKNVLNFNYSLNDYFIFEQQNYKMSDIKNNKIQFDIVNETINIFNNTSKNETIFLSYNEIQRLIKKKNLIYIKNNKWLNENNENEKNAIRGP